MVWTLHLVLDPFGVSFYILWGKVTTSFFSVCGSSFVLGPLLFVFPAPLVEKTVLSPLNRLLASLSKIISIDMCAYFWTLDCIPLFCMSVLMLVLHCFDFCSFVVSFEIRWYESFFSNFSKIIFKLVLVVWGPLKSICIWGSAFLFLQKSLLEFW